MLTLEITYEPNFSTSSNEDRCPCLFQYFTIILSHSVHNIFSAVTVHSSRSYRCNDLIGQVTLNRQKSIQFATTPERITNCWMKCSIGHISTLDCTVVTAHYSSARVLKRRVALQSTVKILENRFERRWLKKAKKLRRAQGIREFPKVPGAWID